VKGARLMTARRKYLRPVRIEVAGEVLYQTPEL
jgi:hypothetical protein